MMSSIKLSSPNTSLNNFGNTRISALVLEWYNEVFLKKYSEINNAAIDNDGSTGLTSRQLADATFQIKRRKLSSKHILENYIEPLINSGYIDKVENKEDRRSYLYYPVLNVKQKFRLNLLVTTPRHRPTQVFQIINPPELSIFSTFPTGTMCFPYHLYTVFLQLYFIDPNRRDLTSKFMQFAEEFLTTIHKLMIG
ncbi:MAG: hypothetical protein WA631_10970 [Nitrososphaeraceae archaeon]